MTLQDKFNTTRTELAESLIERDDEIDLVLTALVAREHVLLVGPPGTAKSMLADSVVQWIDGSKFSILLTKFSTPEEVFGPISLTSLKRDEYKRCTAGYLPNAQVAFIDEIWKASSAILNTMLKILNERTYCNGTEQTTCPLALCVAASNEWPSTEGGKELSALFDRFVFRRTVRPVQTESGRERLLWDDLEVSLSTRITLDEVAQAASEAALIEFSDEARDAFRAILQGCRTEGIIPGDRRQRKAVQACRAFAWLCGADEVQPTHLEILSHVLWDDPAEQPAKVASIVGAIASPVGMTVQRHVSEVNEIASTTDTRNTGQVYSAVDKLREIYSKLEKLNGDPRAKKARKYVRLEMARMSKIAAKSLPSLPDLDE